MMPRVAVYQARPLGVLCFWGRPGNCEIILASLDWPDTPPYRLIPVIEPFFTVFCKFHDFFFFWQRFLSAAAANCCMQTSISPDF